MRKQVLLFLLLLTAVVAAEAHSQFPIGTVDLYSDSEFTRRYVLDTGPAVLEVYVVHDNSHNAYSAIQFRIASSPGMTGVWVGESSAFTTVIGTTQDGVTIGFGSCLATPIHLLTMTYVLDGGSAIDSYLEPQAHPDALAAEIEALPCAGFMDYPSGERLVFNPAPVPVGRTTWGRIKELYR